MLTVLPWHQPQWQQYVAARQQQRLSHALLLTGPDGIGLNEFAHTLSASLLCFSPGPDYLPCGVCKSCELFIAGNHSDYYWIEPRQEEGKPKSKEIKVDQIRELINYINLKSQFERYKIAIFCPAESMNRSASNSLLKTLEEPPAQSLLILLSQRPDLLPVTIRSRCQQLRFNPAYNQATAEWLAQRLPESTHDPHELLMLAGGAPIAALNIIQNAIPEQQAAVVEDLETLHKRQSDPVGVAEKWGKLGAGQVLLWLLQVFNEMLRIKTAIPATGRYAPETLKRLQRLTNRLDLYKLVQCHDLLLRNYGLSTGHTSFETRGLLEDFTIYWQSVSIQTGG